MWWHRVSWVCVCGMSLFPWDGEDVRTQTLFVFMGLFILRIYVVERFNKLFKLFTAGGMQTMPN